MELRNIGLLLIVLATVNAASLPSDVGSLKALVSSLTSTLTQLETDFDHMQTQYDDRLAQMIEYGNIPGVAPCNRTSWLGFWNIYPLSQKQTDLENVITRAQVSEKYQNRWIETMNKNLIPYREDIARLQSDVADSDQELREQKTTITKVQEKVGTMTEVLATTE